MASYLSDEMNQNFLNNITNTNNYCSTITCPENYISEQSGFAICNSVPCDVSLGGTDIDICCTRLCNSNSDCENNKVCVTENNIQVCIDSCINDNDCNDELKCLDNDNNGIFYCQSEENRFMALLNRLIFIIERAIYSDSVIVDTVILIIFAYLISKLINTFNININIT
tara:strand:+ start:2701 stop:3207 length:507 start_codon:yes stop_codon:yes gene_type:complete